MISKAILFEVQLFEKMESYCQSNKTNANDLISVLLTTYLEDQKNGNF